MNKNEFLNRLKEDLSSLTDQEIANALKYYEEYFADAGDDGEETVISEFVSPENIASKIKDELQENKSKDENILKIDFNNYTYENASEVYNDSTDSTDSNNANNANISGNYNKSYNKKNSTWKIVVLLCTAPIWLPLVIALASTAFGLFMAVLGVSFSIAAIAVAGFAMIGAGFLSVGYGIAQLFTNFFSAFYPIGAGLVVVGVGVIVAYLFTKLFITVFKSQFKFAGFVIRSITGKFSGQNA